MKTKRVLSGMLAGLLLLTGTGVLGYAWTVDTDGQKEKMDSIRLDTTSSVVNAADMMAAAGLDSTVELGEYTGPVDTQTGESQLWEPETGSSVLAIQATQNYLFLSDVVQEPESWSKHGSISPDKAPNGNTIQLKVDGEVIPFPKGVGAHAKSELIYDISTYTDEFTTLSGYFGVDYSQNGKGNGVKFTVSVSQDKGQWTQVYETGVVKASDNAVYVNLDVSQYRYIKLTALDNGADGNDHSVYGDLRLLAPGYDISSEGYNGLETVAEYDAILTAYGVEENLAHHRDVILRREFVSRMGYQTIQAAVKAQPNVGVALDWLLSDTDALQLFLEAGSLFNGSSGKTLMALGNLYQVAQDQVGNSGDAYVYKKMMLATAVAYCRDIKTYMVNYGGNSVSSDPVAKYTAMKSLYDNGYFARKEEFRTYPMELVRYVMDAKMDDSEIQWLREYSESRYQDLNKRLNGYSFVNYTNTWYDDAKFYSQDNLEMWDAKYDFVRFGVSYGVQNLFRLWMMMEKGGICWGISGMGMNLNEVHGIPSVNTYQPQHEAYLVYTENQDGDGIWTIWNNVGGWAKSYSRWGSTISTEARLLLGWGCMDYINYNKNNTTYILLAQAALNDYDQYLESMYANFLAGAYPIGSDLHEAALNRCLAEMDFNLDGMYGLIQSYRADANTTNEEWLALAKQVVEAYTYYPAVMVDLLGLITPHMSDNLAVVEVNTLKTQALQRASKATAAESLQPDACREIANSLLGQGVELATFSFDGEHANAIVLHESYDQYEFMVRYSLDGGETWEKHMVNGQEVPYTPDHIITLTPQQLERVTAEHDIVVGLVGVETTYTIDIKEGTAVQPSKVYQNDDEDLFLGSTASMEYSVDGGKSWQDYQSGLDSTTRFAGDVEVRVRYKAHGVYLQGPETTYTFHAATDTPQQTYLQLQNVTLVDFSSQQSTSADHAAANFIDGNGNTAWHTKFGAADDGKFYTVKLDQVRYLSKLTYLPGGGQNGRLKSGEVYVSLDGESWTLAHTFQGLQNNAQWKEIVLPQPVAARYVKVVATETYYNNAFEKDKYFSGKMLNFYVDTTQSYISQAQVTYSTQAPTNQPVTATLVLPQGCQAEVTEYVFDDNGTYTFHYTDANGVAQTLEAQVTWIDKQAPTGELHYSYQGWTNQPVTVTLENLSEDVEFVDGSQGVHVFEDNHSYTFTIRDAAGNESTYTATVSWMDPTKPEDDQLLTVADGEGETTLTLNIDPNAVEVLAVNGQAASGNVFTVTENGTYTFQMRLKETGYTFEHTVVVDWLAKAPEDVPPVETPPVEEKPSTDEGSQTPVTPDEEVSKPSTGGSQSGNGSQGGSNGTHSGTSNGTSSNTSDNTSSSGQAGVGNQQTAPAPGTGSQNTAGAKDEAPTPQPQQTPESGEGQEKEEAESVQPSATPEPEEPAQEQQAQSGNVMTPVILAVAAVGVVACVAAGALWLVRRRG